MRHHRHGLTRTPEYRSWSSAKQRCTNARNRNYKNYGGRDIRMCERWMESFELFLEDMGARPSPRHSLDRIDNDGDYEPDNCRWATPSQQRRNDSQNRRITFAGETHTLAGWAELLGINRRTLGDRLERGWTVKRAFSEPATRRRYRGELLSARPAKAGSSPAAP